MDVAYWLEGIDFEWDIEKAASNLRKHGVAFEKACEVFLDPFVRLVEVGTEEEARDAAIGMTETWRLLFVVHILRKGNTLRIISARPATPSERRKYEEDD